MKQSKAYSILWDKKMQLRFKCRFYKAVERSEILNGLEFSAVDNMTEQKEAEIVMLR